MNMIQHLLDDDNMLQQLRDFAMKYELTIDYVFEEFCVDGVFHAVELDSITELHQQVLKNQSEDNNE